MKSVDYTDIYPYRRGVGLWKNIPHPFMPVELFFRNEIWRGTALIDTGAQFSMFDADIAVSLGINLNTLPEGQITGVGGTQRTKIYRDFLLRFNPLPRPVRCTVYFCDGLLKNQQTNLLGRTGILNHVQLGVNEAAGEFYLALRSG